MTIKNNLQKMRVYKKLTQIELAEILNISTQHVRSIEKDYKYPNYLVRSRICKFFNVSQNQMFYKEE